MEKNEVKNKRWLNERGEKPFHRRLLSLICHLHVQQKALPRMSASRNFILPQFYHSVIFRASHNFLFCFSSKPVLRSLLMPFNQFGCQPDPTILLFICLLTMNPNNFPWTNRDWKRKRQNKRKWNNNRSGTVWCSVPTIGSVKATRAGQSWLMRIWKGRQLSPHIRLGLLWYLIFPNSFLVIQKKTIYCVMRCSGQFH